VNMPMRTMKPKPTSIKAASVIGSAITKRLLSVDQDPPSRAAISRSLARDLRTRRGISDLRQTERPIMRVLPTLDDDLRRDVAT
jgi:hypothetical protein